MEQNTNSADELTEEELRNAGASASYIAYYKAAKNMGKSTPSTNHAEKAVREGMSGTGGGGFHDSLWNADPRFPTGPNPYGADTKNQRILEEAGIYKPEPTA